MEDQDHCSETHIYRKLDQDTDCTPPAQLTMMILKVLELTPDIRILVIEERACLESIFNVAVYIDRQVKRLVYLRWYRFYIVKV